MKSTIENNEFCTKGMIVLSHVMIFVKNTCIVLGCK